MAKYIFDTSILVHYVRGSALALHIENSYSPSILPNYSLVSVVSLGEMYSLSYRLKWGQKKQEAMKRLLYTIPAVDINHLQIIEQFAELYAYRLGKHPTKPLPAGASAKCISDNDLWIAATASLLKATLFTLDKDFLVFNGVFLDVI